MLKKTEVCLYCLLTGSECCLLGRNYMHCWYCHGLAPSHSWEMTFSLHSWWILYAMPLIGCTWPCRCRPFLYDKLVFESRPIWWQWPLASSIVVFVERPVDWMKSGANGIVVAVLLSFSTAPDGGVRFRLDARFRLSYSNRQDSSGFLDSFSANGVVFCSP